MNSNYYSTESSLKYARRSNIFTTERADGLLDTGLDVCVRRLLTLLPLIVIVLDLMDTELLRDAARARVFKGQARVVLQSRGDEDT